MRPFTREGNSVRAEHPCAALPVSVWSVSVTYCHYHQAYSAHYMVTTQTSDGAVDLNESASIAFGPFDSSTDAQNWALSHAAGIDVMHLLYVGPEGANVGPTDP